MDLSIIRLKNGWNNYFDIMEEIVAPQLLES